MSSFDQFANQGGPAAENADALAEAKRVTDEQLRNADYSVDLPEPLGREKDGGGAAMDEDDDLSAEERARRLLSDPTDAPPIDE